MSQLSYAPRVPALPSMGKNSGLTPEFVTNSVEIVNSVSRIGLKVTLMAETLADDMTDIVTILAAQQKSRLLAEMRNAGYDIPEHLQHLVVPLKQVTA